MTLATEIAAIADLMEEAADTIDAGVWGSFADEEKQHPIAKDWRRVERRLRKKAKELHKLSEGGGT